MIGKISFENKDLVENFNTFFESLKKTKPNSLKNTFINSITIASSMGPGIKVKTN